ncbi:MAG: Metallo-dependent phosphatase, partial [candidate division WS6 bacterium 34_10]
MKVIVIGDTHLSEFDEAKYNFLVKIISSSDKVIINGDFWEKWFVSLEEFLDSEWNKLFPLLLSKNTVYISGNHDPLDLLDDRAKRFCIELSDFYDTEIDGIRYHFEHGNRILKNVENSKIIKFYSEFTKRMPKRFLRGIKRVERVIYSLFPKIQYDNAIGKRNNEILKSNSKQGYMNIFSDTHCP